MLWFIPILTGKRSRENKAGQRTSQGPGWLKPESQVISLSRQPSVWTQAPPAGHQRSCSDAYLGTHPRGAEPSA